ncbi:MAG: glucosaminidase domain-containing protein [Spirochaetaceae bacterium]|jgi:hypothetical protein|nr:glucosaminidase domain-containing protein [Spirochaetaceae bacterium]
MRAIQLGLTGFIFFMVLLASCSSAPKYRAADTLVPEESKRAEIPESPELILGRGSIGSDKLAEFLLTVNPRIEKPFAQKFAQLYVDEAAMEGVNHDIAFSQMCLETGFLSFGGLVKPDMNNFCGLGAIGPGQEGESFPSTQIGIRAQIQHLKAYATEEPLKQPLVDPRYRWVRYGSAPTIYELAGAWAVDRDYGKKIKNILDNLYAVAYGS